VGGEGKTYYAFDCVLNCVSLFFSVLKNSRFLFEIFDCQKIFSLIAKDGKNQGRTHAPRYENVIHAIFISCSFYKVKTTVMR